LVRVAFLEDHAPMREALASVIAGHPGFRLLGGWGTLPELMRGLGESPADVVLMDIQLGESMDGISATSEVRRLFPGTAVLVLTVFDQPAVVFEALSAGAVGYVLKGAEPGVIVAAIEEVAMGGAPMTGTIARMVIERFHGRGDLPREQPGMGGDPDILSHREAEVLGALAAGCRYKEVAARLGVSHNTVRSHVRRIFEKLHAHGATEAARKARAMGVRLPD